MRTKNKTVGIPCVVETREFNQEGGKGVFSEKLCGVGI
jgi:hypothetical protein